MSLLELRGLGHRPDEIGNRVSLDLGEVIICRLFHRTIEMAAGWGYRVGCTR
jgi:hypothetical protein